MKLLDRLTVILEKVVLAEESMVLEDSDESDPCRIRIGSWGVDDTRLSLSVGVVVRHSFRELFSSTDNVTFWAAASLDTLEDRILYEVLIRKRIGV
jgi:hypothetical protein